MSEMHGETSNNTPANLCGFVIVKEFEPFLHRDKNADYWIMQRHGQLPNAGDTIQVEGISRKVKDALPAGRKLGGNKISEDYHILPQ